MNVDAFVVVVFFVSVVIVTAKLCADLHVVGSRLLTPLLRTTLRYGPRHRLSRLTRHATRAPNKVNTIKEIPRRSGGLRAGRRVGVLSRAEQKSFALHSVSGSRRIGLG